MGCGMYNASDWNRLKNSRSLDNSRSEKDVFLRTGMDERFDPRFIKFREARDSQDHPESTPIIVGLDVTGSMGYLAHKVAKEALNETMMKLYSLNPVKDPALMFAAYGDYEDGAPLQVTQFESDIRIAEQLLDLWIENHGQGQVVPNYLWHFAAEHTVTDNYEKRGKKGFLFTIGDNAECRMDKIGSSFERVFDEQIPGKTEMMLKKAMDKYEIFHIFLTGRDGKAASIVRLLPGRTMAIAPDEIDALPEVLISTMQLALDGDKNDIIDQWSELKRPIVERALKDLNFRTQKKGLFF